MATHNLLLLPGDGIGPEVMAEVDRVLAFFNKKSKAEFRTETDIVGDEEICSWQFQRLHERRELVRHMLDARPERSLETRCVRSADSIPTERMDIGTEMPRRIELVDFAEPFLVRLDDLSTEFQVPKYFEASAGIIVVEADERHPRRVEREALDNLFH